jgi:hypothetical protein
MALLIALFSIGCGTVANLKSGEPEVYGGLGKDVDCLRKFSETAEPKRGNIFFLAFWLPEVCVTSVTDTLTIPAVLCLQASMVHKACEASSRSDQHPETAFIDGPVQWSSNIPEDPPDKK